MTVTLTINGTQFFYPETGDTNWGPEATDWASAVTTGMLQKAGGLFVLLAEADFGSGFGLKSLYYKSRTANPAAAGSLRLAVTDNVSWRNNANSGDLALGVNGSDKLTFNGTVVQNSLSVLDTNSIDLTLLADVLSADVKLSAASASALNQLVNLSIQSDGLKAQIPNASIIAAIPNASTSVTGLLTSTDWNTFNGKQAAGSYITALTGDVTATGPGSVAATIAAGAVSLAKMANLAANSIIGNNTGSSATPIALTVTQATAMLNVMVGDSGSGGTKGLVPAPAAGDASKLLSGAGTYIAASGATVEFIYNSSTSTTTSDTTSFVTGSTGAVVQNITVALHRRVRATTTITDRDLFFFQFDEGSGWITFGGTTFNGSQNYTSYTVQGSTSYGFGSMVRINTTDIDIYFGTYAYANSGSYAAAGSAWSANGGSTTKWRVMRVSL